METKMLTDEHMKRRMKVCMTRWMDEYQILKNNLAQAGGVLQSLFQIDRWEYLRVTVQKA